MDEEDIPVQQSRTDFATRFFNQFHQYKKVFLRYWWIPLVTVAISVAVQSYLLKKTAPAFESKARMIVNVRLSMPSVNVYSEELNDFFGTQVALMQSDKVKNRVDLQLQSSNPNLHPTPVKVDVTLSAKTSIFNLRAVGGDPDYVEAYLQATMDEYIKLKRDLVQSASSATQTGMEEELKRLEKELQSSREDLLNYQASNSVVFLQSSGGNSAAEELATRTHQLDALKSELQLSKALTLDQNLQRLHDIEVQQSSHFGTNDLSPQGADSMTQTNAASGSANDQIAPNSMPFTLGGFEEDYLKAKQQIILLQARLKELSYLQTNSYEIVELNDQITRQQNLVEIYKEQSQEQLENQQHTLDLQIQNLEIQVKDWELKAMDVSKKMSDFETLKENHLRVQNLYDQMQANLQTIDANKGIGQESVTVLESASPSAPTSPETTKHLMMAGLIGLFLGIGILVLINQLDDRPSSFTELEHLFDMPVLGQIPWVKPVNKNANVPVLQLEDQRYPLIEAYRSLRSAFLYKDWLKDQPVNHPKTIVIASASPNDGKSMTAANLAITLAQAGAHVLLVDADLRRGGLHEHFAVANGPGLAEILSGQCEWGATLIQTSVPNLHFIPSGKRPRHSHNLFANAQKFLEAVAGHFDYYVIDTAPVMVADDVLSLAPHVDGVIMVVRAGFTSGRIAHAALDMLRQRRVNILGLVFNAVQTNTGDFYYYRSKEYYAEDPPAS